MYVSYPPMVAKETDLIWEQIERHDCFSSFSAYRQPIIEKLPVPTQFENEDSIGSERGVGSMSNI